MEKKKKGEKNVKIYSDILLTLLLWEFLFCDTSIWADTFSNQPNFVAF